MVVMLHQLRTTALEDTRIKRLKAKKVKEAMHYIWPEKVSFIFVNNPSPQSVPLDVSLML